MVQAKNWVAEACDRLGGVLQAAAVAKVTLRTMYGWRRRGCISLLDPALRLARALRIPVERFASRDVQTD